MVYVVRLVRAPVRKLNVATMKLFCAKCSPTPSALLSLDQGVKMLFRRKIPILLFIFLLLKKKDLIAELSGGKEVHRARAQNRERFAID